MKDKIKICLDCGISSIEREFNGRRCTECRKRRQSELAQGRSKDYRLKEKLRKRRKKSVENEKALDEMALRAQLEGISYGKLMARLYMKEQRNGKSD